MRVGDFGVVVVPVNDREDVVIELESGHVLARPGTVYRLRLRNFGPLRCVASITIDGTPVAAGGLVLEAYSVTNLERPVDANESGRFTVIAEGDERAFGPDGGRDNPDLGLIEVKFRRELPSERRHASRFLPDFPALPLPTASPLIPEPRIPLPPGRPMAPPDWTPGDILARNRSRPEISAIARSAPSRPSRQASQRPGDLAERAAGTGLTGHSTQSFESIIVGPLEQDATVVRLRIVIGTEEALAAPRPLPEEAHVPERPAARP